MTSTFRHSKSTSDTSPGASTGATGPGRMTGGGRWAVALCWVAVALDGFDLVVIGAVIPTLSQTGDLGFTDASLTTASTLGLVGVGIGALLIGPITDRFGRRRSLIACITWFSLLTLAVALAGNVAQFTALRFLAGLGLGACLPTALAYMSEDARPGRRGTAVTRMMTGYHVGAVLTALLALWLIDAYGWESMFVVGGAAGLLTVPVLWARLPESQSYLRSVAERDRGTAGPAADTAVRTSAVVRGRYLPVSIGICVASFMGLLLVYGLNTWLPKIMGEAGYSIKAGTGLLLILNVGAIAWRAVTGRRTSGLLVLTAVVLTGRTAIAMAADSTFLYFLQPIISDGVVAATFLLSLATARPMVARLAGDFYPMDAELALRPRIRRLFWHLTAMWAVLCLAKAAMMLWLLQSLSLDTFVLVKSISMPTSNLLAVAVTIGAAVLVGRKEGLLGHGPELRVA